MKRTAVARPEIAFSGVAVQPGKLASFGRLRAVLASWLGGMMVAVALLARKGTKRAWLSQHMI
ncbi:MAG: hypothetical protein R3256_02920 [Thalassovita sp.]|nr:hypothetical protein [Thalassovita sp.]